MCNEPIVVVDVAIMCYPIDVCHSYTRVVQIFSKSIDGLCNLPCAEHVWIAAAERADLCAATTPIV